MVRIDKGHRAVLLTVFMIFVIAWMPVSAQTESGDIVQDLSWSPDGNYVAAAYQSGLIEVVDAATLEPVFSFSDVEVPSWAIAWSPDGTLLAAGLDNALYVWDIPGDFPRQQPQLRFSATDHTNIVLSIAWSPDSSGLASLDYVGTIIVWNVLAGTVAATGPVGEASTISWGCGGDELVTSAGLGIFVIDPVTAGRQPLAGYERLTNFAVDVACSPDGNKLALSSYFGLIWIYDISTGTAMLLHTIFASDILNQQAFIISLSWHFDSRLLAAASQNSLITIWDADTGIQVDAISTDSPSLRVVAWSPIDARIAFGGEDEIFEMTEFDYSLIDLKGL